MTIKTRKRGRKRHKRRVKKRTNENRFEKKKKKIMDRKNKPDLPDCYRKLCVTSQNKKCLKVSASGGL